MAVAGRFMAKAAVRIIGDSPVKIPAGGTARVHIAAAGAAFANRFQLELSEPPDGITIQKVSSTRDGAEILLQCDAAKAKPGLSGNLIVNAFAPAALGTGKAKIKATANRRRTPQSTLPAIPFEIVRR